ncbi:acyl carrier protein [Desulfocicer vacuolatum DSM 3385]|uniref:Acyl carrier protein n=1 Tax=Desulfocicer vacuolatum DSM 3385 TaxID=1121400 RepID=A0A1W2C3X0_9BACT|nr:acyl carrier protein [Desulfocicer vacuolatum]SMC79408.1 acyl carrier protein [Desulfocicer vacuolatum DSM 3385]
MSVAIKVKKIIAEKLSGIDLEDVVSDASLVDDLGADSLALVELIMSMEEAFDMEIDDDDAEKMVTVQDIVAYVEGKS